ncbi:MAG: hypothetical protein Q4E24_15775 [bacterium]|nr:hypothetical protein [bacterium]
MSLDSYITEREQEAFQRNSCAKIIGYSKVKKNVREWYKIFGFQFPHTSENNYRDAWFHYRRLYQEHSAFEMTSQIATFDEHIQRAEKDSMVFFFQRASELLEFW